MPVTQTASHPADGNPPTFESIMAILDGIAERQKEADKRFEESKEYLDRRLGSLTNLFGDMTEAMIAPKICKKFEELGLYFPRANPNVRVDDYVNDISYEIDLMLENGDKAMLIEVKTKLTIERINKHLERMEKQHRYADLHGDKRTFLGAVAGIVVTDEIRKYSLEQGFYFIEYQGENFFIIPPTAQAKEW